MKKFVPVLFLSLVFLLGCTEKTPPPVVPSGTLELWTAESPNFFEALGREFTSTIKADDLNVRVTTFETQEELQETLIDTLADGNGPDVIVADTDFIFQNSNKFVPLGSDETLNAEYFSKNFLPASFEGLVFNSAILGVPLGIDSLALIFNDGNLQTPPVTWEEFRTVTKEISQPDNSLQRFSHSGAAIGRVDNITRGTEILENILFQLVKDFFSEDRSEAVFAQNQGVTSEGVRHNFASEALRFFTSFADPTSSISPAIWNEFLASSAENKDYQAFVEGKVSVVFGRVGDVKKIVDLIEKSTLANMLSSAHVRVAPLPQFGTTDIPAQKRVIARVIALAVPHSSKDPSLAWQFLKFALRPDSLRGFYQVSKIPSPKSDLLLEQEADPVFGSFASQAPFAHPLLLPLDHSYFQKNLEEMTSQVISHMISPEDGLARLEKNFTQKLKRKTELKKEIFSKPQNKNAH